MHHLILPSFPTRRSSDLGLGYTIFMIAMAAMRFLADGVAERFGLTRILQASGIFATVGLLAAVIFPQLVPSLFGFLLIDRKSTRLNSSHGYISYAVFCLN